MGSTAYGRLQAVLSITVFTTIALSGCSGANVNQHQRAVSNSTPAVINNTVVTSNKVASTTNASDNGTSHFNSTNASRKLKLSPKPITLLYAGTKYNLPVPTSHSSDQNSNVSAVAVPGGLVWIIPPGYPDASGHLSSAPSLWFTPGQESVGTKSLWSGAKRLWSFQNWQASAPELIGATGGYVLMQSNLSNGTTSIDAFPLPAGGQSSVQQSLKSVAVIAKHDLTGYGRGVFVWKDKSSLVHVVRLSNGATQTVHFSNLTANNGGSNRSSVAYPPQVVSGGVNIGAQFVPIKLIPKSSKTVLPQGFHWIGISASSAKDVAVPDNWTVVKHVPGGSSTGLTVSNPKNHNEKVTLWFNACAGCYSPDVVSGSPMINAPDSPLLGATKGETYNWLNDHAVAYTVPSDEKSKYPTYGLTRTFTDASGDEEVTVNVPANDKQTATLILNSALSQR